MKSLRLPLLLLLLVCAGCQSMPAPVVVPFADESAWVLLEPLEYTLAADGRMIQVPAGFVTDFATIPRAFWQVLPVHGRYGKAAIVHDYLYWTQSCSRDQADRIMLRAMTASGVKRKTRFAIYRAVRLGGGPAWARNRRERLAGVPRMIPESLLASDDFLTLAGRETWPEYRTRLLTGGVREAANVEAAAGRAEYCSFGDP
jgi:hypothetical protein